MRRILFLTAALFLFCAFRTNAPLTLPREPVAPAIDIPADPGVKDVGLGGKPKGEPFEVSVVFADGRTNPCTVYLLKKEMTFFFEKDGSQYKSSCPVPRIAGVEILQWKGYVQEDKSTWAFYPVRTRVTLKDGQDFVCEYFIEEFGKVPCLDRIGQTTLYSYYYDYRVKGAWRNCGKKDKAWPETHQPGRVVKKIVFL